MGGAINGRSLTVKVTKVWFLPYKWKKNVSDLSVFEFPLSHAVKIFANSQLTVSEIGPF